MSSVDQRDAEFALSFFSVAGSAGIFMMSLFVACALAFLIRVVKSEPFETRAFIIRTAICWVGLLVPVSRVRDGRAFADLEACRRHRLRQLLAPWYGRTRGCLLS